VFNSFNYQIPQPAENPLRNNNNTNYQGDNSGLPAGLKPRVNHYQAKFFSNQPTTDTKEKDIL
jgi:hypothetical protein